jgi:hypothetical protein
MITGCVTEMSLALDICKFGKEKVGFELFTITTKNQCDLFINLQINAKLHAQSHVLIKICDDLHKNLNAHVSLLL